MPDWTPEDTERFLSPRRTNRLAVVALVLAVAGEVIVPFAFGAMAAGVLALRQMRLRFERGRPLAWVAIALGYLELVFLILVIVAGVMAGNSRR